ncbi:cytochrome c3 family protein [Rhizobium sp. WSM1325]|uniref:cytochrome c3 family protein n=1 Tax=Rhizobium sp. WSM1325 TaxID=3444086 RepID=UPI000FED4EA3|nr:cytochrome c3 family protein [Rhizobium leguminosarum]RWY67690.1 cytochrome C [Rhizobium leguminosarum]
MVQVFTASADTRLRALVLAAFLVFMFTLLGAYAMEGAGFKVGWALDQPVPFSHQHHVGGLGLDCRYCHTSVEVSSRAGLPPTHICMSCHSQIWTNADALAPVRNSLANGQPIPWQRVSRLPDYVYFNHSAHVAKGVPCVTCHGRVDEMPLLAAAHPFQMGWCLDCHRNPTPQLRPPEEVTRMDWTEWKPSPSSVGEVDKLKHDVKSRHPQTLTECHTCHR